MIGTGLLITCVLCFYSYKEINKKLRKYAKEERKEYSELLNTTTSFFEGIPTIRLYMQEEQFVEKYKRKADRFSEQSIHLQLWKSLTLALSGFILEMMPVITIILGVMFVARGQCTIGSVFAIYSYTSYLNEPIRNLTDLNLGRQQAKANEQRLEELMVNEKQAQEQSISELSGGERRRVGLARALLGNFEMLILDEPTAEIDSKMEEKIITLLNRSIDNDKIVVLITHRPGILDICNQIVRVGEL